MEQGLQLKDLGPYLGRFASAADGPCQCGLAKSPHRLAVLDQMDAAPVACRRIASINLLDHPGTWASCGLRSATRRSSCAVCRLDFALTNRITLIVQRRTRGWNPILSAR